VLFGVEFAKFVKISIRQVSFRCPVKYMHVVETCFLDVSRHSKTYGRHLSTDICRTLISSACSRLSCL